MSPTVRQARADDADAVVAFAEDIWSDRQETVDYIPDVFEAWVETDGPDQHTVVAEVDGTAAGLCQVVMLTDEEAWLQGMRVAPAHRGAGLGLAMVEHCFEWARERGATVGRNMVFSWNDAGLGQSVAAGFEPDTSFRFAHPEPDAAAEPALPVKNDPAPAWRYWTTSDARTHLSGLALDSDRAWALSELSRDRLDRLVADQRVVAVDGTKGMACRTGLRDGPDGDCLAEYGVAAWADREAAAALFDAIRADAAELGVDGTRVLLPETPRHVAEAAAVRAALADWPDFVLSADLTG